MIKIGIEGDSPLGFSENQIKIFVFPSLSIGNARVLQLAKIVCQGCRSEKEREKGRGRIIRERENCAVLQAFETARVADGRTASPPPKRRVVRGRRLDCPAAVGVRRRGGVPTPPPVSGALPRGCPARSQSSRKHSNAANRTWIPGSAGSVADSNRCRSTFTYINYIRILPNRSSIPRVIYKKLCPKCRSI